MLLSHSHRIMWIMKIAPLYCSCFENLWFKPAPVIFSISWRNFSWEARKIVLQGWISLHTQNVKYDMKPCDKYKIPPYSSFFKENSLNLTQSLKTISIKSLMLVKYSMLIAHWKQYQSNHCCLSNTQCSLKTILIKSLMLVKSNSESSEFPVLHQIIWCFNFIPGKRKIWNWMPRHQ